MRGFPLRSVSGFASSGVTSLFFDWTTFDVLARVRMNHNAYQDDIPATHFFLMFYVPCQLTSETTERKPGASDNYSFFFLMKKMSRLSRCLDKSKVFGTIVTSECQIGRENLPIIKWAGSAKQRNETA